MLLFYPLALFIIVSAILVVTSRNIFRSALALALVLFGVACLFLHLGAEFLAAVQIIVYVGAILTLILFAVMLTSRIWDPSVQQVNEQKIPALLVCLVFLFMLLRLLGRTPWFVMTSRPESVMGAKALGMSLLSRYAYPFELVSVVLLAALIGAIAISRRKGMAE